MSTNNATTLSDDDDDKDERFDEFLDFLRTPQRDDDDNVGGHDEVATSGNMAADVNVGMDSTTRATTSGNDDHDDDSESSESEDALLDELIAELDADATGRIALSREELKAFVARARRAPSAEAEAEGVDDSFLTARDDDDDDDDDADAQYDVESSSFPTASSYRQARSQESFDVDYTIKDDEDGESSLEAANAAKGVGARIAAEEEGDGPGRPSGRSRSLAAAGTSGKIAESEKDNAATAAAAAAENADVVDDELGSSEEGENSPPPTAMTTGTASVVGEPTTLDAERERRRLESSSPPPPPTATTSPGSELSVDNPFAALLALRRPRRDDDERTPMRGGVPEVPPPVSASAAWTSDSDDLGPPEPSDGGAAEEEDGAVDDVENADAGTAEKPQAKQNPKANESSLDDDDDDGDDDDEHDPIGDEEDANMGTAEAEPEPEDDGRGVDDEREETRDAINADSEAERAFREQLNTCVLPTIREGTASAENSTATGNGDDHDVTLRGVGVAPPILPPSAAVLDSPRSLLPIVENSQPPAEGDDDDDDLAEEYAALYAELMRTRLWTRRFVLLALAMTTALVIAVAALASTSASSVHSTIEVPVFASSSPTISIASDAPTPTQSPSTSISPSKEIEGFRRCKNACIDDACDPSSEEFNRCKNDCKQTCKDQATESPPPSISASPSSGAATSVLSKTTPPGVAFVQVVPVSSTTVLQPPGQSGLRSAGARPSSPLFGQSPSSPFPSSSGET